MRKKILFAPLWGIFALSLLSSCRTEDGAIAQKQIEDKRFAVFVPKSGQTVNYANGFASLMKKYDQVHLTNLSGINNKPVIKNLSASINKSASLFQDIGKYVGFNIRSQTVSEENGNKWVVFPKVENDKVTGLIISTIRDKETQVVFTDLDSNDGFYKENLPLFQQALDKYLSKKKSKLNAVASIKSSAIASVDPGADPGTDPPAYETDIEGVTVKGKPKTSDNGTNGLPSGPSTPIACEQIQGCYNPAETGGGSPDAPPTGMVMPPPPKNPINDIKKYLSCFDQTKSANLTVYAQNMLASPPGHAFITLQQGNNIMTFGFYPKDPYLNSLSGRGVMGEDSLHPYNQALNVGTISPAQLQNIISRAIDFASTRYDLAVRNCADFAREALNIANVPGANWDSNWSRPTDIANIINAQKSGVTGEGDAPVTRRTCE